MTDTDVIAPHIDLQRRTGRSVSQPYAVVLHNDDYHEMDYVVQSLVESVPELSSGDAFRIMMETHKTGKAIVIVCPLEQGELYRDRIRNCGLAATVEKV